MEKQTPKVEQSVLTLTPSQKEEAVKKGINLSDPQKLVIMVPKEGIMLKETNKPLSAYNNGLLKMMIDNILKKLPAGSGVVNENLPEKIKARNKNLKS